MYCASCEVRTEFICCVEESRPPLWSRGQSSWLQTQRSGFNSRHYQIFWEVVGPKRGPLSLMGAIQERIQSRKSRLQPWGICADYPIPLYPQKLALTSLSSGGRSIGIVPSWTQATEFVCLCIKHVMSYCYHCVSSLQLLSSSAFFVMYCTTFLKYIPWLFQSTYTLYEYLGFLTFSIRP
jgi:hypothetical protein